MVKYCEFLDGNHYLTAVVVTTIAATSGESIAELEFFLKPITRCSNAKAKQMRITFVSDVKTALNESRSDNTAFFLSRTDSA